MKNILILTKYTFREALSRKIFITFFAVSTFILLIFLGLFVSTSFSGMTSFVKINGKQPFDLFGKIVYFFKFIVISPLYGGGLFLAVFSSSSFIPKMLEKGSIDLLLSKPVSRSQIIWGKFYGGVLIVLLNIAYLVIGIWFLIGFKFGVWDVEFLYSIFSITFAFALLYSLIILIGILTQSSGLAMMVSYLIFFVFSPILLIRDKIAELIGGNFIKNILDGLYYITPQTSGLGSITNHLALGKPITDYQPVVSSFIFIILILYLSIIIFNKKDY